MVAVPAEKVSDLTRLCRRFGVKRLYLFGSAAQGNFRPESSDLDFLVELDDSSPADYIENYFGWRMNSKVCFSAGSI